MDEYSAKCADLQRQVDAHIRLHDVQREQHVAELKKRYVCVFLVKLNCCGICMWVVCVLCFVLCV